MIFININEIDYSQIITETLNKLFKQLFNSLDYSLYSSLDKCVFITPDILNNELFNKIFNPIYGLPAIANALLIGFVIYYCIKLSTSYFFGTNIEKPYQFLAKIFFIIFLINFSSFFCEQILNINNLLTQALQELGKSISSYDINFSTLINNSQFFKNSSDSFNLFSFSGILISFFSFGLINLLFSYSIRYVLIKIFILISPFAILSLSTASTSWFFKIWFRTFISFLLEQIFIVFILIFLFSINIKANDLFSQILYISTIFILTQANSYMRNLIGGLSTHINSNLPNLKHLFS